MNCEQTPEADSCQEVYLLVLVEGRNEEIQVIFTGQRSDMRIRCFFITESKITQMLNGVWCCVM